jgi:hypothetical protein
MRRNENNMSENSDSRRTSISNAQSIQEIADYWDSHSLADSWDQTQEVEFEIKAQRRHRIVIDPEVFEKLVTEAHSRGISPETLVNLWLAERLQSAEA